VVGTYATYSYSWSPYFRGRMLRGELSIAAGQTSGRLVATYSQLLPRGRFRVEGSLTMGNRSMHLELCEPGDIDQVPAQSYRALVKVFDENWLASVKGFACYALCRRISSASLGRRWWGSIELWTNVCRTLRIRPQFLPRLPCHRSENRPVAIVFDMHGLLFDTESVYQEAISLAALEGGHTVEVEVFRRDEFQATWARHFWTLAVGCCYDSCAGGRAIRAS
jgi:hypothetical protein